MPRFSRAPTTLLDRGPLLGAHDYRMTCADLPGSVGEEPDRGSFFNAATEERYVLRSRTCWSISCVMGAEVGRPLPRRFRPSARCCATRSHGDGSGASFEQGTVVLCSGRKVWNLMQCSKEAPRLGIKGDVLLPILVASPMSRGATLLGRAAAKTFR
jgi:hypothetical protein